MPDDKKPVSTKAADYVDCEACGVKVPKKHLRASDDIFADEGAMLCPAGHPVTVKADG